MTRSKCDKDEYKDKDEDKEPEVPPKQDIALIAVPHTLTAPPTLAPSR